MSGEHSDQRLDLRDLSEEELCGVHYADGVSEFRSKVGCLLAALSSRPPQQLKLTILGQAYSIFVSTMGGNLDIGLSREAGHDPAFPTHAHLIITHDGLLRISNDGINVVPPQQPLQPYMAPGPEGVDINVRARTWLDPFVNSLVETLSV